MVQSTFFFSSCSLLKGSNLKDGVSFHYLEAGELKLDTQMEQDIVCDYVAGKMQPVVLEAGPQALPEALAGKAPRTGGKGVRGSLG